ncbi:hypothetical protein PHYSODRAFT_305389 [Phytophthora sojae]|uniref:Uncharacterized protein n=1 Tax=Phytophthora sojae (strain P6497) TaxID=1094619 RepID=G5A376_PHYSP|nr:hypothetical protein PHYSODRAFT_305389 [Phytophthora sojae]EGZ10116.1 hypothetical protein PHYSODRAFT_305389 [Phytophthora sojae]|eukprot:XP_009534977.1 hypothetical protein PHYSODRAFT_305389 [Phytophthora sojae]
MPAHVVHQGSVRGRSSRARSQVSKAGSRTTTRSESPRRPSGSRDSHDLPRDAIRRCRLHPPLQLPYSGQGGVSAMTADMVGNAVVMVQEHFMKRLTAYIRLELFRRTGAAPRSEVERLRTACFGPDDGDYAEDEHELREWLGFRPYKDELKRSMSILGHIEALRREMAELPGSSGGVDLNVSPQDEVALGDEPESDEDFIQELRSRKGLRAFTLLPVSTSFVPMDVAFDGFTLQGFCARLYNRTWSNPVGIPVGAHGFETENCKFAYRVAPNGYSVSILLTRPKNAIEVELERLKATRTQEINDQAAKRARLRKAQTRKNPRGRQCTSRSDRQQPLPNDWNILPADYEADRLVAIDPGMRAMATAVCEDIAPMDETAMEQRRQRNRRRNRRRAARRKALLRIARRRKRLSRRTRARIKRAKRQARRPPTSPRVRHVGDETVISIKTREYRHLAGFNKAMHWFEGLK